VAAQIPLILDVDTGIDDALMVAWAATREDVELLAVSTLSGNVDAVKATENTRRVLGLVGAGHVPVHRGATRPLARAPRYATDYHGDRPSPPTGAAPTRSGSTC
jgi:inosine-uridine nucleoside N-ribohydrolase